MNRKTHHSKNKKNLERGADPGHGLARVLSKLGIMSRREASIFIQEGRVKLNGKVIKDPEKRTFLHRDIIELDEEVLQMQEKIYLMMHKPVDVITTYNDPQKRTTVYDLLPKLATWVFPVGRLDAATSGLLLFTNDTVWGEQLTNHEYGVAKTYEVKVRGALDESKIKCLEQGVRLDDGYVTQPCQCATLETNEGGQWLKIILYEGKNRQVRRMIEAVGSEVVKLRRVAIGNLSLKDLKPGETRFLSTQEAQDLIQ